MISTPHEQLEQYRWEPQPQAARLTSAIADEVLQRSVFAANLARRMQEEAGTRFGDWVDHFTVDATWQAALADAGFEVSANGNWVHPGAVLPPVRISEAPALALKVESVEDFLVANGMDAPIEGAAGSQFRRSVVNADPLLVSVIERHGWGRNDVPANTPAQVAAAARHLTAFRERPRRGDEARGFAAARSLITEAADELGRDWACDLFFRAEREYWQSRNRAARVQKARQDRLGLGWANHDHHTYRSSREWFPQLIGIFEQLGFYCRERFYAGREAKWGAQVLEHPVTGIVIFADVDMTPEELFEDFSHVGFSRPMDGLGTVGLWCALHGEAFLQAGMHHLECQFDFQELKLQLEAEGVSMMAPFTNFSYLTQAFTTGERWAVDPGRVEKLLTRGLISAADAQKFLTEGAVGSHLENLERNDGYKGFNQTGVSDIIARTDPRRL